MVGGFSANLASFLASHLDLPLALASELGGASFGGAAAHSDSSPRSFPDSNIHPQAGHCHNNRQCSEAHILASPKPVRVEFKRRREKGKASPYWRARVRVQALKARSEFDQGSHRFRHGKKRS